MGGWAVVVGLLLHGGGAVGLATLFALLIPRDGDTTTALVPLSMLMGLLTYVVIGELLLDFMDPPMARAIPNLAMVPYDLLLCACFPVIAPVRRLLDGFVRFSHRL